MKLNKLVSLVLALAMVLTMFCGISLTPSAEGDTEAATATTVKAYQTYNSAKYTEHTTNFDIYNSIWDLEDVAELEGMNHVYFYIKGATNNEIKFGLNDADGTFWCPNNVTPINVTTVSSTGTVGTDSAKTFDGLGVRLSTDFEGYVVLSFTDDMLNHPGYTSNTIEGFDITTIQNIKVFGFNAEKYGDFGFAASKGDAVNAILTKLGKGELNSTYSSEIIPMNIELNTAVSNEIGGGWSNYANYQAGNEKLADAKFIGFRLKADTAYNFNFQLQAGETRIFLNSGERLQYNLSADGTLVDYTAPNTATYGDSFDGWVILPIGTFDWTVSVADLNKVFIQNQTTDTFTIGDFAISTTTVDALAAYYTVAESGAASTAIAANKIGGTINMLEDTTVLEGKKWFGLKLASTDASDQTVKLGINISSVTNNYALHIAAGSNYYLVTDDGTATRKTADGYADLSVPAGFNGYVFIEKNSLGSVWGTATADQIDEYLNIGFFSGTYTNITANTPVFADTFKALYDEYAALAADDYKDNTYLINKNDIAVPASSANGNEIVRLDRLKAATGDALGMQWLGFRLKTTGSNNYFQFYLYENDRLAVDEYGDIVIDETTGYPTFLNENYWTNNTPYYLVNKDGTITEGRLAANGQLWAREGAAFDGYVVIPLSSFVEHPASNTVNGELNPELISYVGFNASSYGLTAERFAMAKTRNELIEYLANAEMLYSWENRGDVTGNGAIDILDLVRYKKYAADDTVEVVIENLDANGDEDIDFSVELVALVQLILDK
ncbi:MAG: hypothetical protein IKD04_03370 [Clostridia bacterium]|nr:hypothetical protein [Clostridia bacterium]